MALGRKMFFVCEVSDDNHLQGKSPCAGAAGRRSSISEKALTGFQETSPRKGWQHSEKVILQQKKLPS